MSVCVSVWSTIEVFVVDLIAKQSWLRLEFTGVCVCVCVCVRACVCVFLTMLHSEDQVQVTVQGLCAGPVCV